MHKIVLLLLQSKSPKTFNSSLMTLESFQFCFSALTSLPGLARAVASHSKLEIRKRFQGLRIPQVLSLILLLRKALPRLPRLLTSCQRRRHNRKWKRWKFSSNLKFYKKIVYVLFLSFCISLFYNCVSSFITIVSGIQNHNIFILECQNPHSCLSSQ